MLGTLRRALAVRGIPTDSDHLSANVSGEVYKESGVLVIKRIKITYNLNIERNLLSEKKESIDRAVKHHADQCPVHKSIGNSIQIETDLTTNVI